MAQSSEMALSSEPVGRGLYYELEQAALKSSLEKEASWENIADEELEALYAEFAEEDVMLALIGLVRYTELLE